VSFDSPSAAASSGGDSIVSREGITPGLPCSYAAQRLRSASRDLLRSRSSLCLLSQLLPLYSTSAEGRRAAPIIRVLLKLSLHSGTRVSKSVKSQAHRRLVPTYESQDTALH
jgi:hypothetical protein